MYEQAMRRKTDKVSFIPELRDLDLTRLAHPDSLSSHFSLSACRCVRIALFLSQMVSQNRQLHMDPMTTDSRSRASGESIKTWRNAQTRYKKLNVTLFNLDFKISLLWLG